MSSVRESSYEVLRAAGMTTFFGNPGSNELPFLQEFPADFRYVLALHEGAALAMADGYAQASGGPVLVSLHSAAGVGQAMGNLVNSYWAGTPLVIMSGQQHRNLITMQGMLTNIDATTLPRPLVKWSFEAPSPQSVPAVVGTPRSPWPSTPRCRCWWAAPNTLAGRFRPIIPATGAP